MIDCLQIFMYVTQSHHYHAHTHTTWKSIKMYENLCSACYRDILVEIKCTYGEPGEAKSKLFHWILEDYESVISHWQASTRPLSQKPYFEHSVFPQIVQNAIPLSALFLQARDRVGPPLSKATALFLIEKFQHFGVRGGRKLQYVAVHSC